MMQNDPNVAAPSNLSQIVRVDARNCFVESLNDYFFAGKFHLGFTAYDLHQPQGNRQTNRVNFYISAGSFLVLTQRFRSGELEYYAEQMRAAQQQGELFKWMAGTAAAAMTRQREDGHDEARSLVLSPGKDPDTYLLTASSGAGVRRGNGIIAPLSGVKPDQRVSIRLTKDGLGTLLYVSEAHYNAWLTACYSNVAIMQQGDPSMNGWNPYQRTR